MTRIFSEIAKRAKIDPLGVSMAGPRLAQRIRGIIEGRLAKRISYKRIACIIGVCAALCVAFLGVTLTRAQDATPDWERAAGGKMDFDAASVKRNVRTDPSNPDAALSGYGHSNVPFYGDAYPANGGLFNSEDAAVSKYIEFAYKLSLPQARVLDSAMPKWAAGERFDIQARAPAGTTKDQMRLMMQSLLADRFHLKAHFEARNTPVYALELVKPGATGPKLRPYTGNPPCVPGLAAKSNKPALTPQGFPAWCGGTAMWGTSGGAMNYGARNVSMESIAQTFFVMPNSPKIDRPVIDRTGLTGDYDLMVTYWPRPNSTDPEPDDAPPILFEALKRDLGLKLEATTAPFNQLVIDHIEEPTAN